MICTSYKPRQIIDPPPGRCEGYQTNARLLGSHTVDVEIRLFVHNYEHRFSYAPMDNKIAPLQARQRIVPRLERNNYNVVVPGLLMATVKNE